MQNSTKEDILRRILSIKLSESLQPETAGVNPPLPMPASTPLKPLSFPPLPDVLPSLRAIGLTESSAMKLVHIFHGRCAQLQSLHRERLAEIQRHTSPAIHDSLLTYFQKMFMQTVDGFRSELLQSAQFHCERMRSSVKPSRRRQPKVAFNQAFIPFLEKYFEYNAYPSAADRSLMARKSIMTERQIEVWFQNHRNRARKEGKSLARLRANDPLPADLSLSTLDETMGDFLRTESELYSDESDSERLETFETTEAQFTTPTTTIPVPTRNPLNSFTPCTHSLHVSFLDAVTHKSAFQASFSPPSWPRRPTSTADHCKRTAGFTRLELDLLVDLFSRLTVREGPRKHSRKKTGPLPRTSRTSTSPVPNILCKSDAATRSFTTVLCSGRHPAFVVPPAAPHRNISVQRSLPPLTLAGPSALPGSRCRAMNFTQLPTASPSKSFASSMPASSPSSALTPSRRKKSPQLPRRVPGSLPSTRPFESYHPYSSLFRASSSTSLGSTSSSYSSGTHSPSCSSASPSPLTTPDHGTMSLPDVPCTSPNIYDLNHTIPVANAQSSRNPSPLHSLLEMSKTASLRAQEPSLFDTPLLPSDAVQLAAPKSHSASWGFSLLCS